LKQGGKLPVEALEQFLHETKLMRRARRFGLRVIAAADQERRIDCFLECWTTRAPSCGATP